MKMKQLMQRNYFTMTYGVDENAFPIAIDGHHGRSNNATDLVVDYHVADLIHFVERLECTQGTIFTLPERGPNAGKIVSIESNSYGFPDFYAATIKQLRWWIYYFGIGLPHHQLHPYVGYFMRTVRELGLSVPDEHPSGALYYVGTLAQDICCKFNQLVEAIRRVSSDIEVQDMRRKALRTANDNWQSLIQYEKQLFSWRSRLMVVRVDLMYLKQYTDPVSRVSYPMEIEPMMFLADMKRFREALQRHGIFEHLVGYALKLEHGIKKGFHTHGLFFFNGSRVQEDITRGRLIGEFWARDVTRGSGTYYNCNADAEAHYYFNGLGIVHDYDTTKRFGIQLAMEYLIKPDTAARCLLDGHRTCMMGLLPSSHVASGRPRNRAISQDHDEETHYNRRRLNWYGTRRSR